MTSAERLVLQHQLDWRSDLQCCRSLEKRKKGEEDEEEISKKKINSRLQEVSGPGHIGTFPFQSIHAHGFTVVNIHIQWQF